MPSYSKLARQLLKQRGGVGSALEVQAMQPYSSAVGAALDVQPQQPGQYYPQQATGMRAAQGPVQQGTVAYNAAAYDAGGLSWLGFGTTSVPAGAVNQSIQVTTQRPFRPQICYLPSTNIGLLINGVFLEGTNLFANTAGIPIELWSEVSNVEQIQWPSLDTSTGISFQVSNPTAAAVDFQGGFWGTQVRR